MSVSSARRQFIVARPNFDLYRILREEFAQRSDVRVLLDRRVGSRRGRFAAAGVERRSGPDRRRVHHDIRSLGVVCVREPDGPAATA